jgi:hypothetical protein
VFANFSLAIEGSPFEERVRLDEDSGVTEEMPSHELAEQLVQGRKHQTRRPGHRETGHA